MNPTHLDSRYGADSSLLREEAAPAASGTAGAAPDVPTWADIEWDTRAERAADV